MPFDRILEWMSVPDLDGAYLIGTFARRVTVYSQQVRAINLVDAIHFHKGTLHGKHVAIVGAGAAGMTAAARILHHGGLVTVFEQNDDVLSVQQKSAHRWLHPVIYDWPFVDIGDDEENDARLPVMNWSADYASGFATTLKAHWTKLQRECSDRTKILTSTHIDSLSRLQDGLQISYTRKVQGADYRETKQFPLVILAIGFGLGGKGERAFKLLGTRFN